VKDARMNCWLLLRSFDDKSTSRFSTTIFIYSSLAAAAASAGVGSSVDATSVPADIGVGF